MTGHWQIAGLLVCLLTLTSVESQAQLSRAPRSHAAPGSATLVNPQVAGRSRANLAVSQYVAPESPAAGPWAMSDGEAQVDAMGESNAAFISDCQCPACQADARGAAVPTLRTYFGDFWHTAISPAARHRSVGQPLTRGSWRNRPLSMGWFMGATFGDELLENRVDQDEGYLGGYRFGWDWHHYWGTETRFGFGSLELSSDQRSNRWGNDIFFWDVAMLYYPWGDTRWRPYLMAGVGVLNVDFDDEQGVRIAKTVFEAPLGVGLKYRWSPRIALRMELADQITTHGPQGVQPQHNLQLTFGMDLRFGGQRKSYWPYNASTSIW